MNALWKVAAWLALAIVSANGDGGNGEFPQLSENQVSISNEHSVTISGNIDVQPSIHQEISVYTHDFDTSSEIPTGLPALNIQMSLDNENTVRLKEPPVNYESTQISTGNKGEINVTTPSFQSFEDWKRKKLHQEEVEQEAREDGKRLEVDSFSGTNFTNADSIILSNASATLNANYTQESSPPTSEKRDMSRSSSPSSPSSSTQQQKRKADGQLADEMEIGISMFTGTDGEGEDQGKLYKDRFNFASLDCAATIVKTNREAKGANAILLDNKDSYLLNECSAQSKFIIIELCEDILVDEVLIGNYEFYSSMFKDVRISASDRFPAQQWTLLGEYKAENVRNLQVFKVRNPIIWSKFLKIDLLTHYGDEYYCPVSSVQVHGKTMIEQFKEEEEAESDAKIGNGNGNGNGNDVEEIIEENSFPFEEVIDNYDYLTVPGFNVRALNDTFQSNIDLTTPKINCSSKYLRLDQFLLDYEKRRSGSHEQCPVDDENIDNQTGKSLTSVPSSTSLSISSNSKIAPQDSIYKNIVKRLSLLESNSTLSLLYVEEQSKLLSEAFSHLESQQTMKFQTILEQLNSTIHSQMNIFQKLNTDVYNSFSGLFEYQQHSFDANNKELKLEVTELLNSVMFYRNLTYFCMFLILLLFVYIILTKDLYIDETYVMNNDVLNGSGFPRSPSISSMASSSPSLQTITMRNKGRYHSDNEELTNSVEDYELDTPTVTYRHHNRGKNLFDSFSKSIFPQGRRKLKLNLNVITPESSGLNSPIDSEIEDTIQREDESTDTDVELTYEE